MTKQMICTMALMAAAGTAVTADSGVTRKLFERMDVPAGHEAIMGAAELSAGTSIGRHSHHGVEFGYIAEGEVDLMIDGNQPLRLKTGDFYKIDAGKIHDARSINGAAKAVATWIVQKGKPLSEPAQ